MQNVAHAELGGRKAISVIDYRLGKVKSKNWECSLFTVLFILFDLRKGKEKLTALFSFLLQQSLEPSYYSRQWFSALLMSLFLFFPLWAG